MNLQQKKLLALCSLFVIVGIPAAFGIILHDHTSADPPPLGSQLPRFSAQFVNGTAFSSDALIGRKTALIFFTTDCPHCQRQLQNFDTLAKEFEAPDLQLVALSLHDVTKTEEFLRRYPLEIPILLLSDTNVKDYFGVAIVPAVYLYDDDGQLVGVRFGERSLMMDAKLLEDFVSGSFSSPK